MTKKEKTTLTTIYVALAILLLLCIASMPYWFYQLVRFVAFAGFGYSAYLQYKDKSIDRMFIFIILALLFQPFWSIGLGRGIWSIVDVIVAGYLIYLLLKSNIKK